MVRSSFSGQRRRTQRPPVQPTFDSAADAAAAVAQVDGYKPREERSWEEFHPNLDLDTRLQVFGADEVDGITNKADLQAAANTASDDAELNNVKSEISNITSPKSASRKVATPPSQRRRPGRPPRRPDSLLTGLGSPPAQKIVPLPAQNPRERLTLPKPSFRKVEIFTAFEEDKDAQRLNYVDQTMANVGYQITDLFQRQSENLIRLYQSSLGDDVEDMIRLEADGDDANIPTAVPVGRVEYDMDEQDVQWLEFHNVQRRKDGVDDIRPQMFEITMTLIEKEWHALERRIPKPNPRPPQTHRPRSSSAAAVNGEPSTAGEEQDSKCAICDDGDCENTNAIVFCDGCDLAVHQECYGVPFIPEGQWLCRKCVDAGVGAKTTCIFCPNTDGAFKLTAERRWAHLLCSIWIPEVTIANTTFMEPIVDVANVPRPRWKLHCYLCNQRMGACIQCGNKNCFQAFHVTCARRARLFLKMKQTHGSSAIFDASVLKAFCDKHVPSEWRRDHHTERATVEAKIYYRREMKGRRWADSQQSALGQITSQALQPSGSAVDGAGTEEALTTAQKKQQALAQKNAWRLACGAPIVPNIVYNAVELSLQRFTIRKRKEFVEQVCKYWTMKREARRGAALLKRLQLQTETFSTTEIARRDFAGMGVAGGPKRDRRIAFAGMLETQMQELLKLCEMVREREEMKLKDVELLREVVDTVYFPITPLLWPVLVKAQALDSASQFFTEGFKQLQMRLEERAYTSVAAFSADLGSAFRSVVGLNSVGDAIEAHSQLANAPLRNDATLSADQKDIKKLAKRITKAVHPTLQHAIRSEAELGGRPFEEELLRLDAILHSSINPRGSALPESDKLHFEEVGRSQDQDESGDVEMHDVADFERASDEPPRDDMIMTGQATNGETATLKEPESLITKLARVKELPFKPHSLVNGLSAVATPPPSTDTSLKDAANQFIPGGGDSADHASTRVDELHNSALATRLAQPVTPPPSEGNLLAPLSHGGIPWYVEAFDPVGTDIHEERWIGREVLRSMSEELSEIDEDELKDLGVDLDDMLDDVEEVEEVELAKKKTLAKKRKRAKQWW